MKPKASARTSEHHPSIAELAMELREAGVRGFLQRVRERTNP